MPRTCRYFPKREELSFRAVLALPKASRIGFACRIWRSRRPRRPLEFRKPLPDVEGEGACPFLTEPVLGRPMDGMDAKDGEEPSVGDLECVGACASVAIAARYWMTFLVDSVFPAPDSPVIRML